MTQEQAPGDPRRIGSGTRARSKVRSGPDAPPSDADYWKDVSGRDAKHVPRPKQPAGQFGVGTRADTISEPSSGMTTVAGRPYFKDFKIAADLC
jgi:hypothetical protein